MFKSLFFWVIVAFFAGSLLGILQPAMAVDLEPLGTTFVKLIKIFITPIIFLTVSTGIAQTGSLKKLGAVGLKAFIYFEVVSTLALGMGWLAAVLLKPGESIAINITTLDASAVSRYIEHAHHLTVSNFLQHLIPNSIVEPFVNGDLLQVLVLAIFFGIALLGVGKDHSEHLLDTMDKLTQCLFQLIKIVMYAAPIGVFGAMAYSIGKFGTHLLIPLLGLMGIFYLTGILFVVFVLGAIAYFAGFSIFKFLKFFVPELLLVLGTASSEVALPHLLKKLELLGCERETVGVVVPMGYSFNLDGTNIYIALAALFIAQALGIELSLMDQIALFATAMLTSKGAAGVTGAGFITLAATLSVVSTIPPVGIVLVLGIDRFMSTGRSLINYIGNGVAALVISRWQNEMSKEALRARL